MIRELKIEADLLQEDNIEKIETKRERYNKLDNEDERGKRSPLMKMKTKKEKMSIPDDESEALAKL